MSKRQPDLIAPCLEKARGKLKSAKDLLDREDWEDSVSRSYYAAFLAARAALLAYGLQADSHRGISSLFGLTFLKTGKMDRSLGKLLNNLRADREAGDYELYAGIDQEMAENALREARKFVKAVEAFLKKEGKFTNS